jgi:hypothetical protein
MQHCRVRESRTPADPSDLTPEIQHTLAALADVETRYEVERERLDHWTGPTQIKSRLLACLEARHQGDRLPLVQRLADLQREMTSALMMARLRMMH